MLDLLTEREVSRQLHVSLASLRRWRLLRRGPHFKERLQASHPGGRRFFANTNKGFSDSICPSFKNFAGLTAKTAFPRRIFAT